MSKSQDKDYSEITVNNIGGIDETSVSLFPGVTVLSGENATNRTSLLRAIAAAIGSDNVSMKADAGEAYVELRHEGETYTRDLTRQDDSTHIDGNPYLDNSVHADLFAFLFESNEARRAVESGEDLRDVIMKPVDTEEIQQEIETLVKERRDLKRELDELDTLKDRLPSLEERRKQLQDEIEEKREELVAKEAELKEQDTEVEETREEKAELEEKLSELRSTRSDLEDTRYDLETERDTIKSMKAEKQEVESELADLPEAPVGEIDEIESRIDTLRQRKSGIEVEINEVQNVIGFNQDMLEDSNEDVLEPFQDTEGGLTDELLPDDSVLCWTCGSEVPEEQIEATIENLQELSQNKLGEVTDIESELAKLRDKISELREHQNRREQLHRRLTELETGLENSQETGEELKDRREALREKVESLENEIETLEDETYEEILDIHKEANQVEYELGRLEGEIEEVEAEIASVESRLDEDGSLKSQIEHHNDQIEELRTKIERIEIHAIEEFNDHMATVLELLEYRNIQRVWLERKETEVREGRRKVAKSVFELNIVRQTDSGTTYRDTIEHLSESEREVTGLIFALAGYLAHEVYEMVPYICLDSVEAIDSSRIATLVEYLEEYSEYLVVALLPEDAAALDEEYQYVNDI